MGAHRDRVDPDSGGALTVCGICGVALSSRSRHRIEQTVLERMRDVITHRGPDGAGLFLDDRVGLGHRRLSIVDVARGAQPMQSDDGSIQLIYNGEVYNHPEIMAGLRREGVQYATHCDTETILRLYERHGADLTSYLRGMFAIAIWDRRSRELLLIRDRFGVKPLYYALLDDGSIVFGSEIKALLASALVPASLNADALPDYLANHAPSGDETLFQGVKRLPPGHTLAWRDGTVSLSRFWSLHYTPTETDRSAADLTAEYRERFIDAVRMRLMADVPLGMFLSGGIDSAAITAVMSRLVSEPVKTFSVAFAEREANELAYARLVSQQFRTDHHEVVVTTDEFFDAVPRLVWHEDEPMAHPSSVALNFVSRLASRHVKVVLTGEGSDETLGGYHRYRTTIYNLALGRRFESAVPAALRRATAGAVGLLPASSRTRQRLGRTFLTNPSELDVLYFDNFAVFSRAQQRRLLGAALREKLARVDPYESAHRALAETDAQTLLDRLLYADTRTYLHELLMKQDQMSMAASIESRVPFLDHPLVEFASRLPARLKLRGLTTKYVLRAAMRDVLPKPILTRRKMGFPVPVGRWFRGPYRSALEALVLGPRAMARGLFEPAQLRCLVEEHGAQVADHSERLWSLANLEIWQRIFLDGEAPEHVRFTRAP